LAIVIKVRGSDTKLSQRQHAIGVQSQTYKRTKRSTRYDIVEKMEKGVVKSLS